MQIRQATLSDTPLLAIQRLAFLADVRATTVDAFDKEFMASTTDWVTQCLADGTVLTWLAEDDEEFVGMVSLLVQPTSPVPHDLRTLQGHVINMFVLPPARGQGVGRRLMATLLDAAPELGLRKIALVTTPDGRPLYEDLGFATDHRFMTLGIATEGTPANS